MMTPAVDVPMPAVEWLELIGGNTTLSRSANDMLRDCYRMLPNEIKTEVSRAKKATDQHTRILRNLFDPTNRPDPTVAVPHLTIGRGIGRQLGEDDKRLYRATGATNSYFGNLRINPDSPRLDPPDFLLISCPFAGSRTEIETVDVDQLVQALSPAALNAATNADFELCIGNRRTMTALLDSEHRKMVFSDHPMVLRGTTTDAAEALSEISAVAKEQATTSVLHAGSIIMINNAKTLTRWMSPETDTGQGELLLSWIDLRRDEATDF